jgi:hypothetical protein
MKKARPATLEIAGLHCARMTFSIKRKDSRFFDQRCGKRLNETDQRTHAPFRQAIGII